MRFLRAIFRPHFYFVTPYGKSNPYGLGEWKVVVCSDVANYPSSALSLNSCLDPIVCVGTGAHQLLLMLYQHNSLLRCKTLLHLLNQSPVTLALLSYNFSHSYTFFFSLLISSSLLQCSDALLDVFGPLPARKQNWASTAITLLLFTVDVDVFQIHRLMWFWGIGLYSAHNTLANSEYVDEAIIRQKKVFSFCHPKCIKLEMCPQCSPSRISTLFVLKVFHDTELKFMCLLRSFVAWLKPLIGNFQCGKFQRIILWVFQL